MADGKGWSKSWWIFTITSYSYNPGHWSLSVGRSFMGWASFDQHPKSWHLTIGKLHASWY